MFEAIRTKFGMQFGSYPILKQIKSNTALTLVEAGSGKADCSRDQKPGAGKY